MYFIKGTKYTLKFYRSGAKIQLTGTYLGVNILGFNLFEKKKKIYAISSASIISFKFYKPPFANSVKL